MRGAVGLPQGPHTCQHLDFVLVTLISDFWALGPQGNTFLLF